MKKNEVIKSSSIKKSDLIVGEIERDLKNIQEGKIKTISATLGLIDKYTQLFKIGALNLNAFLIDKIINKNDLASIDFKNLPANVTHNDRIRLFLNLVLIPALKTSVDEMKKNDPYKYETLRDIAPSVLSSIINDFIYYDKDGSCFSDPIGNQPRKIKIKKEKLVLFKNVKDAQKRYNSEGHSPFYLSFEKLKSFSDELLVGRSERVTNQDPTFTKVAEKISDTKKEINSNVAFTQVQTKKSDGTAQDPAIVKLETKKRENEVTEMETLVFSVIDKLAVNSEFLSIQKIALYIAKHKDFMKFQKTNFDSALNFNHYVGNQPQVIDIKDLDLSSSTDKLIAVTLKEKKVNK